MVHADPRSLDRNHVYFDLGNDILVMYAWKDQDMGGSQALCALRKCDAAFTEEGKKELEVLHKNVRHIIVEGREYALWSLIWMQAFKT